MSLENASDGNLQPSWETYSTAWSPIMQLFFYLCPPGYFLAETWDYFLLPFHCSPAKRSGFMFSSCCGGLEADALHDHFTFCRFLTYSVDSNSDIFAFFFLFGIIFLVRNCSKNACVRNLPSWWPSCFLWIPLIYYEMSAHDLKYIHQK